jgi:hypothetical protein
MRKLPLPTMLGLLALLNTGCSLLFQHQASMGCQWDGDPAFTLRFFVNEQRNVLLRGPKQNFTELALTLTSDTEHAGGLVARQPRQPDDPNFLIFQEGFEGRTDAAHRRFWLVQDGKVVATLDRDTGVTTGPADIPPQWAKPETGDLMWQCHEAYKPVSS